MRSETFIAVALAFRLVAQQPTPPVSQSAPAAPGGQPITLDLKGAIGRARDYSQQCLQAYTATGLAKEDRVQAKAALFPISGPAITFKVDPVIAARGGVAPQEIELDASALLHGERKR
jgi:hypothetical protein